jgi:hypothetical protein
MLRKSNTEAPSLPGAGRCGVALPEGWCWARLGQIAEVYMGNSPRGSSYNREGQGVPLINGPTDFGPSPFDYPVANQYTSDPTRMCEPGDLLVCVRGSIGRTNVASFSAAIGRGVAAVRAHECQPYINHYIASQASNLYSLGTGSVLVAITRVQLMNLVVPFPPLSEQRRIVTAIEESLAGIEKGTNALRRARANLEDLRASLLKDAVTGRLTESVRGTSSPQESAGELLARILSKRDSARLGATGEPDNLFETDKVRRAAPRRQMCLSCLRVGYGPISGSCATFSLVDKRVPKIDRTGTRQSISGQQTSQMRDLTSPIC